MLEVERRLAAGSRSPSAVVRDRRAGTVSIVVPVQGAGFPVASPREQDALLAGVGRGAGAVRPGALPGRRG